MMKPPLRSQLLIGWIHLCPLLLTFSLFFPFIQSASSSSTSSSPSTVSSPSTPSSPSAIPAPQYFDLRMSALSSSHHPSLHPPLSSSSLSSPILSSSSSFMSIPPTPSVSSSISSMRKSWSLLRAVGSKRGKDEKRSISFNEQAMHHYPANDDDEGRVAKELEKDESDYSQVLEGRRISHSDDGARGSFGQVATHPNGQGLVGGHIFPDEESKDGESKDGESKDEEQGDGRENDGMNEGEEDSRVERNSRNVMRKRQSRTGSQSSSSYAGLLSPGFERKGFFFPSSSFLPSFRVFSSRRSFPSLRSIISGQEQILPRSSYKQHEEEKLIKSGGRKRALSFFAHWRPVDQVDGQEPFMNKGSILPLTGEGSIATSQETSFTSPITLRRSSIQSRKPALLRWG